MSAHYDVIIIGTRHGKAHDLDNVYVVDTGFVVSRSAVNPSLTTIANAPRVGDLLLQRLEADWKYDHVSK